MNWSKPDKLISQDNRRMLHNFSSLGSSLFRFLLAIESESRGEVARRHGARANNLNQGDG